MWGWGRGQFKNFSLTKWGGMWFIVLSDYSGTAKSINGLVLRGRRKNNFHIF